MSKESCCEIVGGLTEECVHQERSDGSDSGLGSEVIDDKREGGEGSGSRGGWSGWSSPSLPLPQPPPRSTLKRKILNHLDSPPSSKKMKKSLAFGEVNVYYFPRAQGFTCVPSQVSPKFLELPFKYLMKSLIYTFHQIS